MKFLTPLMLGMLILVQSCTGQNPAPIKNSTHSRRALKASCSSMKFEGQILSKKNILNVFDCSGWAKEFPELNSAIEKAEENSFDRTFEIFNEVFFSNKEKRNKFFNFITESENRGELKSLSYVLEKSLLEHKALSLMDVLIGAHEIENQNIFKFVAKSNEENLNFLQFIENALVSYEESKPSINSLLSEEVKGRLPQKVEIVLSEISKNMDSKSWKHLSGIFFDEESAIQNWALEGKTSNLRTLLEIIRGPTFQKDIKFLKSSLNTGVSCGNRSSSNNFTINVGQELKHKIEGLKSGSRESFEELLLHGLTKYVAFQEFCEEKTTNQGLKSFFMVLKYAFDVLPSNHDFNFLKKIHQIFGEDRFVLLSFLSSDSFTSLNKFLSELGENSNDEQFIRLIYQVLADLSLSDFKEVSSLMRGFSHSGTQSNLWLQAWSESWQRLGIEEREKITKLLGVFFSEEVKASDLAAILKNIITTYPELSSKLFQLMNNKVFQDDVKTLVKHFSTNNTQKELASFLSSKGLFEFISILTQNTDVSSKKNEIDDSSQIFHSAYIEKIEEREVSSRRRCFGELAHNYEIDTSYYNLVNSLPESCLNVLGRAGYVGQIYLWMNASHNYFRENYGVDDFHSEAGVWSPGMLQFLFSTAIKADIALKNKDGSTGILNNIDEIYRVVTDPALLEMFHQFSQIYEVTNNTINLDLKIVNFVQEQTDAELNKISGDFFKLSKSNAPLARIVARKTNCRDIDASLGANPCHSNQEITASTLKLLRVLKRKNENQNSLIQELIKLYHPQEGLGLPFRREKTRTHVASLDETIRFLYDLSSEDTVKEFYYQNSRGMQNVRGSVIDRLEVVIRDISFENNFYGAYFKNMVASATDYRKDVAGSRKLLVALDHTSGSMRRLKALPKDSKKRLKNVRASYSSLIELSDEYTQADGTKRSYDAFIQGLLAAVAESSRLDTQNFNPYRIPNKNVVDGHNGEFLTEVVNMSGLRHLSLFMRSHLDGNLSVLNDPQFKKIDQNLLGRFQSTRLKSGAQFILDEFLDNNRNQLNLLVEDLLSFMGSLNDSERINVEEIMLKALFLISDERLSNSNIEDFFKLAEEVLNSWPEIREIFLKIASKKEILVTINNFMDAFTANPSSLNHLLNSISSSKQFTVNDFRKLVQDQIFRDQVSMFLNELKIGPNSISTLNWSQTFEAMFSSPSMKWGAVSEWARGATGENPNKLTISLLIKILGEKHGDQYRLKAIIDELFLFHRDQLSQFLSETFKSLNLISD